jgi:hypothetical protein
MKKPIPPKPPLFIERKLSTGGSIRIPFRVKESEATGKKQFEMAGPIELTESVPANAALRLAIEARLDGEPDPPDPPDPDPPDPDPPEPPNPEPGPPSPPSPPDGGVWLKFGKLWLKTNDGQSNIGDPIQREVKNVLAELKRQVEAGEDVH